MFSLKRKRRRIAGKDLGTAIFELYFATLTQLRKDNTAERAQLFRVFLNARPLLGFIFRAFDAIAPISIKALAAIFWASLRSRYPIKVNRGEPIAIVKYANEIKILNSLRPVLSNHGIIEVQWQKFTLTVVSSLFFFGNRAIHNPKTFAQVWRISQKLCRRYPLFVAIRALESILVYIYLRDRFLSMNPAMILIFTEGNPHGCAAMGAASALNLPVVYMSHGAVSSRPVRIKCRLAAFYGIRARQESISQSSRIEEVVLYGFKETYRKIPASPRKGSFCFCLSQNPDLDFLSAYLRQNSLMDTGQNPIVRPHPHSQISVFAIQQRIGKNVHVSAGTKLEDDLNKCSMVFAGNSTVHLDCLLRGMPTAYLPALDSYEPENPLNFISEKIVFGPLNSIQIPKIEEVLAFYANNQWTARFSEFLNLDYPFEHFLAKFSDRLENILKS